MTPKEEAEKLLKEWDFRGTPFNDAGIFVSEMIYENKKYNSDDENEKGYWELVEEELEKMSVNQKTNKEREILYRENEEDIEKSRTDIDKDNVITPKEEAEKLLKEWGSHENAGVYASELIYQYEKDNSDYKNEIRYWKMVGEEIEKMRVENEKELSLIEEEKEKIRNNQKFHLRIYDNHNYMDESEAYNHGQYNSYEEAMIKAKSIVDEFFEHNWKPGVTQDYLIGQYCLYGDDPIILPNEHGKHKPFSARTYAEISAVKICLKLENE